MGSPQTLSPLQLPENFDPANLEAQGIDLADLLVGQPLPFGVYEWEVVAIELFRNRQVSNVATGRFLVLNNQPPLLNQPRNNAQIPPIQPQNLLFSWTPRHTTAPTGLVYELFLYEVPPGEDPQVIVNSGLPAVQRLLSSQPSFLYGPGQLPLTVGQRYAWQVRVESLDQQVAFSNGGLSDVGSFVYGSPPCPPPAQLEAVVSAELGEVQLRWQPPLPTDTEPAVQSYLLSYAAQPNGLPTQRSLRATEYLLLQLPAEQPYQWRVQSVCAQGPSVAVVSSFELPAAVQAEPSWISDPQIAYEPPQDPLPNPEVMQSSERSDPSEEAAKEPDAFDGLFDEPITALVPSQSDTTKKVAVSVLPESPTVEQLKAALKIKPPDCAGIASQYQCGNHDNVPTYSGEIIPAKAGDELAMNSLIISVVDIDGSGNGQGLIKMPMLNVIKLGVKLEGIKVAKGGCIVAGSAETSGLVPTLTAKQLENLKLAYAAYNFTLDVGSVFAKEIAEGINAAQKYIASIKAKKEATRKILAESNVEDLTQALNNCTEIASQSRLLQDSLQAMICKVKAGKLKANLSKLEAASKANVAFMNQLGPALAACQNQPSWQEWAEKPCNGPCLGVWEVSGEFDCKKELQKIFSVTEKTLNDCDKKIENNKPLIELATRAIKGNCGTDIDDKIGGFESDFTKLCDVYRFGFIECLAQTPCAGDDEVNINKLLQTTPQADVSKIKSALLKSSNLDKLIGAIDGDNFDEFIKILTSSKYSGTKPTTTENTFIFNGNDALPFEIDGNGTLTFNSRKNFHFGYYQEMSLKAFDWVTVIFADDFVWNGKKYQKGVIQTIPAIALWALFNQSERNKNKLATSLVFDVGLTFVGIGAIKNLRHLPKIYRIIAATKAGVDLTTGLGGFVMAAGLEDELSLTPEGQEVLTYWTWFNLVYGTASLSYEGVAALYRNADVLLAKGGKLSAGMKAWLPKLKEKLEAFAKTKGWKLGRIKSKYGQYLDEIGDILENGLVKGKYSGRIFNPSLAGGKILSLSWNGIKFTAEGLNDIKVHLKRFGKSSQNEKAIKRIQDIINGKTEITDYDRIFYTHELREYERFKAMGIANGVNDTRTWENCHAATLEDFKINEKTTSVYHPDTEPTIEDLLNEID